MIDKRISEREPQYEEILKKNNFTYQLKLVKAVEITLTV